MRKRQTQAMLRRERSQLVTRLIQARSMTDHLHLHRVGNLQRELERVNERLRAG